MFIWLFCSYPPAPERSHFTFSVSAEVERPGKHDWPLLLLLFRSKFVYFLCAVDTFFYVKTARRRLNFEDYKVISQKSTWTFYIKFCYTTFSESYRHLNIMASVVKSVTSSQISSCGLFISRFFSSHTVPTKMTARPLVLCGPSGMKISSFSQKIKKSPGKKIHEFK